MNPQDGSIDERGGSDQLHDRGHLSILSPGTKRATGWTMKAPSEPDGAFISGGVATYSPSSDFFFRGFFTGSVTMIVLGVLAVSSTCVSLTVRGASGTPARS